MHDEYSYRQWDKAHEDHELKVYTYRHNTICHISPGSIELGIGWIGPQLGLHMHSDIRFVFTRHTAKYMHLNNVNVMCKVSVIATQVRWIRNCRQKYYRAAGGRCSMRRADATCAFIRQQHLKLWRQIKNTTPSVDTYLRERHSQKISSRSDFKCGGFFGFFEFLKRSPQHLTRTTTTRRRRSVPDLKKSMTYYYTCILLTNKRNGSGLGGELTLHS